MRRRRTPRSTSFNPLAEWIARRIWWGILWWMRRPMIKSMRRRAPNFWPEHKRQLAWERIKAQDAWAMKHGVTLLTITINIFFASALFTAVYMGLLNAQERGAFQSPIVRPQ